MISDKFVAYISSKNTLELRREMNTLQKELDAMRRRREELAKLFKRLYEDNVLECVTDEQYRMLAADYTAEQKSAGGTDPRAGRTAGNAESICRQCDGLC